MNRRAFAGLSLAALGGVFVPRFGHWYRQGSGLLVRSPVVDLHEPIALPFTDDFERADGPLGPNWSALTSMEL